MNQLLPYLIFFILFILTKEEISYIYNDDYNYENYCFDISSTNVDTNPTAKIHLNKLESLKKSQIALNAQSCRLNEQKRKNDDGTKCCYASVFKNSKWYFFCANIPSDSANSIPDYIKKLNDDTSLDDLFDEIKIDCFCKKFDIMIITLIISLLYLF